MWFWQETVILIQNSTKIFKLGASLYNASLVCIVYLFVQAKCEELWAWFWVFIRTADSILAKCTVFFLWYNYRSFKNDFFSPLGSSTPLPLLFWLLGNCVPLGWRSVFVYWPLVSLPLTMYLFHYFMDFPWRLAFAVLCVPLMVCNRADCIHSSFSLARVS